MFEGTDSVLHIESVPLNISYNLIGCQSIKAYLFEKILLLLKHLLLILRIISRKCLTSVQTKRTT